MDERKRAELAESARNAASQLLAFAGVLAGSDQHRAVVAAAFIDESVRLFEGPDREAGLRRFQALAVAINCNLLKPGTTALDAFRRRLMKVEEAIEQYRREI
jgi:hypothetical protein